MSDEVNKDSKRELKEKHHQKIEEKKKEASIVRKIVFFFLIAIIVIVLAVGFGTFRYVTGALGPVDEENNEDVEVTIPIGSTPTSIGEILEEEGVINSSTMFRYYIRFQNEAGFQAGDYRLSPAMSMDEIIEELKEGRVYEDYANSFTVPEGLWLEDIFERIAEGTNLEAEELQELARDEEYLEELIGEYDMLEDEIMDEEIREPLEGYMFPARYDFVDEELTAEQVIESMLDRTAEVMERIGAESADDTFHELLTKASIIEGESRTDEERPTISGVIDNRLNISMPLQMDPTIAYAHGEHLSRTLNEHLEIESPYNTYNRNGLPIGPINNPGEASIVAAMEPESHNYLYFFHSPDGEVFFNENLSGHNEVVQQYRE
ncbi:aminodeoxychorismate lyase [Salipaludibacillus keqinensis]|uniref:Endolytic murein transglycosylase n=1 Tax=Salipaludibacillus keqinensis TaxID=2045207 RepID=A0A323TGA5_9BACI|nr:endolytic transglycosylase MltG [Salipaludibacillus keqinensis]PYZ94172.1 aminodeoxychorismate lyase [Salipaludibacillus keqinensis]